MNHLEHPLSSKAAFLRWSADVGLYETELSHKFPQAYDAIVISRRGSHLSFEISPEGAILGIYALNDAILFSQLTSWKSYIIERPAIVVIDRRSWPSSCSLCTFPIMNDDSVIPTCYRCAFCRQCIAKCKSVAVLLSAHTSTLNTDCMGHIRTMLAQIVSQMLLKMPFINRTK